MIAEPGEFSLRRARVLTLVVLIVVAGGIALANLSSEPVTLDLFKALVNGKFVERPFGWPLTWYWRSGKWVPESFRGLPGAALGLRWDILRYSAPRLGASLVIWVVLLAAAAGGCEWLLRRYRPRLRWRPRVSTLLVTAVVAAPTVLANLSFDYLPKLSAYSYGWPLPWYRRIELPTSWPPVYRAWHYSAVICTATTSKG